MCLLFTSAGAVRPEIELPSPDFLSKTSAAAVVAAAADADVKRRLVPLQLPVAPPYLSVRLSSIRLEGKLNAGGGLRLGKPFADDAGARIVRVAGKQG